MRKCVEKFAELMEKKLEKNDYKGGWSGEDIDYLFRRLGGEASELKMAIDLLSYCSSKQCSHAMIKECENHVREECADVANFAMMIAETVE